MDHFKFQPRYGVSIPELALPKCIECTNILHSRLRSVVLKPHSCSNNEVLSSPGREYQAVHLPFAMFASIWWFLGWMEEVPPPSPPSVIITGVRIPADGAPAHLVQLKTIRASDATDGFLFHVPDLRQYWRTMLGWHQRDLLRLDLQQDHYASFVPQHLQQKHHLTKLINPLGRPDRQRRLQLSQRYLLDQRYHSLRQPYHSCAGTYYVMYSFCQDDLPLNTFVPAWLSEIKEDWCLPYYGDVFVVKMAPHEYDEFEWASYANISSEFLDLLVEGPIASKTDY